MAASDKAGKSRVSNFTPEWDSLLVNLILDEHDKAGGDYERPLKHHQWGNIVLKFNKQLNLTFEKANLQSRLKNLKRQHSLFEELCNRSGWGWDSSRDVPVPPSHETWQDVIKINSEYNKILRKSHPLREKLQLLSSKTVAQGLHAVSSNYVGALPQRRSSQDAAALGENQMNRSTSLNVNGLDLDSAESLENGFNHRLDGANKVDQVIDGMKYFEASIKECVRSLRNVVDAAAAQASGSSSQGTSEYSMQFCVQKVLSLHDVPEEVQLRAADVFDDPRERNKFMSYPDEMKLKWLEMKLSK